MGDVSEIFAQRVDTVLKTAEAYFVSIVREAQLAGDLSPHLDPEATGAFLLNAYEGALMRMKSARSASPLTGFKDMVFGVIFHASAVKTQQRAA
jgi:TetR/AcrR family transcriptional repressor of nem operon